MFYCDPCAEKNGWLRGIPVASYGTCEVCGKVDHCYDVKSSRLPPRVEADEPSPWRNEPDPTTVPPCRR